MVEYAIQLSKNWHQSFQKNRHILLKLLLITFFAYGITLPNEVGGVVRDSLTDAYIAVSVFVAFTLLLIYTIEKAFRFNLGQFQLDHPKYQLAISSFLGALPGCGGAIIVVTQYLERKVSFGAIIATLTATMGDAAFLLLSSNPELFLWFALFSFFAGLLTGFIVDYFHGKNYYPGHAHIRTFQDHEGFQFPKLFADISRQLWWFIFIPGIILGFTAAFQLDMDAVVGFPITMVLGITGAMLCLVLWLLRTSQPCHTNQGLSYISQETSFITMWVVMALVIYELIVFYTGLDVKSLFQSAAPLLPLFAAIIGLVPGCGPQIVVTTLFISGLIPFSSIIANGISNDGDALFPVLAFERKTAILATIYTTVPALIFAYSYYFFFE